MVKTTLIYFVIRAINGVLALAAVFVLTRLLTPDQYGVYALGMAGISLCSSVLFQWIAVAVSRFHAAYREQPDILLAEAYRHFARVAVTGLVTTGIFAAWCPIRSVSPTLVWIVGIGGMSLGLHTICLQAANARGNPVGYGLLTLSRGCLSLIAAIVFIRAGFDAIGVLLGSALACVSSVLVFGFKSIPKAPLGSSVLRRDMVAYGLPLTLTYLATMVLDISDRFVIGAMLGTAAVASYAVAYDLAQQVVGAVMNVLFLASYPKVTAAWEQGGALAARSAMLPLARAILLGAPLVTGIFIGLTSEISRVVFGEEVRGDANQIMPWVAIAIVVSCIKSYFLDIAFQLTKSTTTQLRITISMAVVNVILNFLLIPLVGVFGAAMATTFAFLVGAALSWWFGRRINIYPVYTMDVARMLFSFFSIIIAMHFAPKTAYGENFDALVSLLCGVLGFLCAAMLVNLGNMRSYFYKKSHSVNKIANS